MSVMIQDTVPRTSLAILTMPDPERGFRGNHANFIDLIQAGKDGGVFVFVVTTDEFFINKKRIHGHVYNAETDMWTRQLLPLPQVVYNRIPTRTDEQLPEVNRMIGDILKN
ncbi:MAG: YheC/YheD family protein, partial [Gorillibacterium sp.]|nr:YheC/YheD family protein [Gorillibacterium sp.]